MTDELDDIEREERELLAQLAAKRVIKERIIEEMTEKERIEKLNKPVDILVLSFSGNYVNIRATEYREDIVQVFKTTEGRIYRHTDNVNAIPVGQYSKVIEELRKLPKINIIERDDVTSAIHEYLYEPDYTCDLGERVFLIKSSRRANTYDLRQLPGYNFNYQRTLHEIPLSEGWRLYGFAERQERFTWTDRAKEFVVQQVANRLKLDEIAKAEDVELEIPNLQAKLKNYQRVGIKFFELNGGRGILADEMGTGKTLQMIGLCVHMKWKAVVVCPAPLKENWLREIRKFAPQCTTYICQGATPTKFDIAEMIAKKADFVIINYDIMGRGVEEKITQYKSHKDELVSKEDYENGGFGMRKVVHETTRYPWVELLNLLGSIGLSDICIMDEGHYIKNTDSNRSQAARKLSMKRFVSLTGTPVLNRPGELWPMLHIADPVTFPAYETFVRQYTFDGTVVKNVDELKQLLRPLMIRRLKKDVIKELEPINRINSYFELSNKGRKLYDKVLAGLFEVLSEWNPNGSGDLPVTNLLVQIQRLKQVVAIDAVESTADLATEIYDASPEGETNKVLIFSQFKATTYAISKHLGSEALSFVSLSSSREFVTAKSHEQQALIDQFQTDPKINFLCVTEKTAKEGHNITAAKAVIFNDLFWTPAGHQQAEARAYGRVSDLHTIDSYYRIGVNSISEKIMDLLAAKLSIIEQTIEGVEASRADSSIIHELLKSMKEDMWTYKKKS